MKTIYTDGACQPNPGRGGCAAVVVGGQTYSVGYKNSTNSRMEIRAVLLALESIPDITESLEIFVDSSYVVNSISRGWAKTWKRNNWIKSDGREAANIDLWKKVLELTENRLVKVSWTRGHVGQEYNEMADKAAVAAANLPWEKLLDDVGYNK